MARDFTTDIEKLREDYLNGMKAVMPEYFAKLSMPDECDVEDMRKALDLGAKFLGMSNTEKVENMPQIVWNISGGNVQISATPAATESTGSPDELPMIEVAPKAEVESKPAPAHLTFQLDPSELND